MEFSLSLGLREVVDDGVVLAVVVVDVTLGKVEVVDGVVLSKDEEV